MEQEQVRPLFYSSTFMIYHVRSLQQGATLLSKKGAIKAGLQESNASKEESGRGPGKGSRGHLYLPYFSATRSRRGRGWDRRIVKSRLHLDARWSNPEHCDKPKQCGNSFTLYLVSINFTGPRVSSPLLVSRSAILITGTQETD